MSRIESIVNVRIFVIRMNLWIAITVAPLVNPGPTKSMVRPSCGVQTET